MRPLGYVENMAGYACPQCREIKPLFPESRAVELPLPCLACVPFDPEVAAACDRGELHRVDAASPAARAVEDLLGQLIDEAT